MALPDPIAAFIEPLSALELCYCVTGSVAASVYGEPRLTRDIDLVLLLEAARLIEFRSAFPESRFYIPPSETLVTELHRSHRGAFNLIHHESGFKADIYLAGRDSLHAWALRHRRLERLGEGSIWLAPPEYVVLRKLESLREGGLEKHARDIRFILDCTPLNLEFISQNAARLGLSKDWDACCGRKA